jgi:F-type H+-transporting ATPase subunit b
MEIYPLDIAIHLVNIVIFYLIVRLLVYKPVRKFMDARTARIQGEKDEAKRLMDEAQKTQAEYDGKIAEADSACKQIIATGRKINTEAGQKVLTDAQAEADKLLKDARAEAGELRLRALDDAKADITEAAVTMAGRILRLDDAVKENVKSGAPVLEGSKSGLLKTARPCSDADLAQIRGELEHMLGCHLSFETLVEPSLIGGYCAYIDGTVYDFSYAAQLATMKQKLS